HLDADSRNGASATRLRGQACGARLLLSAASCPTRREMIGLSNNRRWQREYDNRAPGTIDRTAGRPNEGPEAEPRVGVHGVAVAARLGGRLRPHESRFGVCR